MGSFSDPALILDGAVSNTQVNASAAIAMSKLAFTITSTKAASANVRISHDAVISFYSSIFRKMKIITFVHPLAGTARFLFGLSSEDGSIVHGRIYRNGVALGTDQTTITTFPAYETKSQDITQDWAIGDTCELWIYSVNANVQCLIKDFRIAFDDASNVVVPNTSNS